jgi:hypothetical protein
MEEAIVEFSKLDKKVIKDSLNQFRNGTFRGSFDSEIGDHSNKKLGSRADVDVHCRKCDAFLFNTKDLKHRDPNYICISRQFIDEKITKSIYDKKYKCSNSSCNLELGELIIKRNAKPLHMVSIKAIKFVSPNSVSLFKQWNEVRGLIEIERYN